jgi:hypothetical protein
MFIKKRKLSAAGFKNCGNLIFVLFIPRILTFRVSRKPTLAYTFLLSLYFFDAPETRESHHSKQR